MHIEIVQHIVFFVKLVCSVVPAFFHNQGLLLSIISSQKQHCDLCGLSPLLLRFFLNFSSQIRERVKLAVDVWFSFVVQIDVVLVLPVSRFSFVQRLVLLKFVHFGHFV